MNRQEILIVVLLFLGLMGWMVYQGQQAPRREAPAVEAVAEAGEGAAAVTAESAAAPAGVAPVQDAGFEAAAETETVPAADAVDAVDAGTDAGLPPEQVAVLKNGTIGVSISSHGATVKAVELSQYRATLDPESGPLVLDMTGWPALEIESLPGLKANTVLEADASGTSVVARAVLPSGVRFERRIELADEYQLRVTDHFSNPGAAGLTLPAGRMTIGSMDAVQTRASARGAFYLGIDTLADRGGASVKEWGRKDLPAFFGASSGGCRRQQAAPESMPLSVDQTVEEPQTWLAVKNKFFVQILMPDRAAEGFALHAERDPEAKGLSIRTVGGAILQGGDILEPAETLTRRYAYYVGPKEYSRLRGLGARQDEVMLRAWWSWFRWLCAGMLWTLNALYKVIPNYGVAIILLTAIVRILFWPVTHKSTESMKRMQEVQPLVTELRARYKDKPQKLNQEIMALYKEHKVNPMAGCLPMLVQMPVFIALYNVLRAAVELRFAGFLWIPDLSEPEGLLQGMVPVAGSLNILPFLMAATMVWQQKLTPSGGDPQQQKMMLWFMPIFMLFILSSMPSGLILYWTVSQMLSIVQLLHQRRRRPAAA